MTTIRSNNRWKQPEQFGDTALHTAARYGHAGALRILISAFCNVNETNEVSRVHQISPVLRFISKQIVEPYFIFKCLTEKVVFGASGHCLFSTGSRKEPALI